MLCPPAAATPPKRRRVTKPPKAQKRKRLEGKRHKGAIKKARDAVARDE